MLIKPDAVRAGATGPVIGRIEADGFAIRGMRMLRLTPGQARGFYREHEGKSFFDGLIDFMTGGPIVALWLAREDAVAGLRRLIGVTDSREADPGTIRAEFGTDNLANAVHASDSPDSARRETAYHFSTLDTI